MFDSKRKEKIALLDELVKLLYDMSNNIAVSRRGTLDSGHILRILDGIKGQNRLIKKIKKRLLYLAKEYHVTTDEREKRYK